jgi:cytochrome b pre-mRNA-processing protein 3
MDETTMWPFSALRTRPKVAGGTIEAIYGMIVAQAREPVFYESHGVPDRVEGRFDMVVLHLWMVLRRLRNADTALQQALFDHFCNDMDANLREMGVGDLTVPKRMKAFGEAFYGRSTAYDMAMEGGEKDLADALLRNLLIGADEASGKRLASYVMEAVAALDAVSVADLRSGAWRFPRLSLA